MSIIRIPNENGQVRQGNRGDVLGEIIASYNLDLTSSRGKIKVAPKLGRILSFTSLGSKEIQDIVQTDNNRYVITNGNVYKCAASADPTVSGNWSQQTLVTDTLDNLSTMGVSYNNSTLFADQTNIHRLTDAGSYTQNWWTATISGTALVSNFTHHMYVHKGGAETLFVTDETNIRYYNAAAGHSTIAIDAGLAAHCIAGGVNAVWVGTWATHGEFAYVYEIYVGEELDGTPVARNAYKIDSRGVFAIAVHGNTPYIITEKGLLQKFDGSGFATVAQLPFASSHKRLYGVEPSTVFPTNSRPVNPNGMKVLGDSIFFFIKNSLDDTDLYNADEDSPSGVWEFDTLTENLSHWGAPANSSAEYGAIQVKKAAPIFFDSGNDSFILTGGGSETETDAGLFGISTETPHGYFITREMEAAEVKDIFDPIVIKARTLANGDKIVMKYRSSKNANFPQYNDITWTAATTFTTTDASFANVAVGNEIEVVDGYGAGHLAHITAISENAGTYTVTIDESIGSNTETSVVRVQNWTKVQDANIYTSDDGEYKKIGLDFSVPWIQFKVSMVGNIELRSFLARPKSKHKR